MYLEKAYGKGIVTAFCALLMYFSMVINESLVARTFGTYSLQLFDREHVDWLVPALGVALLGFAFIVNISGNRLIDKFSLLMALVKIGGIALFALTGLWLAGLQFDTTAVDVTETPAAGFLAAVALGILAYKGFTTITNSGSELVDPQRNVGRAIVISIGICVGIYFLVALAVAGNLTLSEIIQARDFALAQAARPALGNFGLWFTVVLAIIATVSGVIASVFAVSRMLAMLTEMKLLPHSHFGMPGSVQKHTLVYTIVLAVLATVFFDLSRIASLGAIFYIVMDIAVHWGVYWHLRHEVRANGFVLIMAMVLDALVLAAFVGVKMNTDMFVVLAALASMTVILSGVWLYLRFNPPEEHSGG
jgi:amino acid transporter